MIDIALRMLFGDRARFALLVSGICFSTLLMSEGIALFFGITSFSYATADNVRSPIWVVDPLVAQIGDNQPLRDADVHRVRSVSGVAWAAPLFVGQTQARRVDVGITKPVTLVGIDDDTLAGLPQTAVAGAVLDIRQADAVLVDERFSQMFALSKGQSVAVGDVFEMNDRTARVAAIVRGASGMGGATYVYTAFSRTRDYVSGGRSRVTHVLAGPAPGRTVGEVVEAIRSETGLQAQSESAIKAMTARWMMINSPIPFVVGLIVGIGFLVGIVISGQTFYTFVLENVRYLGVFKAMGARDVRITAMILVQAGVVGLIGYGMGCGLLAAFFAALPPGKVPMVVSWQVPTVVAVAVSAIVFAAGLLSVRRIARVEPALVFRA